MPRVIRLANSAEIVIEDVFHRLPDRVINNEFRSLHKGIESMYLSLRNGNDFDIKQWKSLENIFLKIDRSVQIHR